MYVLRCRLPVLEESQNKADDDDDRLSGVVSAAGASSQSHLPRWFTLGHLETKQCELAVEMLNAAKGQCEPTYAFLTGTRQT